ncbi:hypothetical protein SUGI_0480120 [Cryptomeria japonica]|nr:hypothetical protein SUGI_0480120 [Cryptomeria japonica]
MYYVNLGNQEGLFASNQDLYTNSHTQQIVIDFALDQDLFFQKFGLAMEKMGQSSVVTGTKGEIRTNCSTHNPTRSISIMVEDNSYSTCL